MTRMSQGRRTFLKATLGLGLAALAGVGCAPLRPRARVVVVGGGFAGATAARYLRMWDPGIHVTLIDRRATFVSCPMSNLVLSGSRTPDHIEHGYAGLEAYGVTVVRDDVTAIFPERRTVRTLGGRDFDYDRLIVAPGVDFVYETRRGCVIVLEDGEALHAWRAAGPETLALRDRLMEMPDGGRFIVTIPAMPYRCPPGPYERISLVADYFKRHKPRSTVLVFDENPEIASKAEIFGAVWSSEYEGIIEYVPNRPLRRVNATDGTIVIGTDTFKADVLNVIPPQQAGEIAFRMGLVREGERWCSVDWRTCESLVIPDVHVIGDATDAASGMPKSAHMANAQAKICAAAIVSLLNGEAPNPEPVLTNTCYSFVSEGRAAHVGTVFRWHAERSSVVPVVGAGGVSPEATELEAGHAWGWARNIWADTLGGPPAKRTPSG